MFTGSYEQSPRLLATCGREQYGTRRFGSESSITDIVPKVEVELQLKENLADAMMEMPTTGSQPPGMSRSNPSQRDPFLTQIRFRIEDDDGGERRTHYFMEEDRLNWPQTSLTSSNPLPSLTNDEDLLDFELESETCLRSPPNHRKYLIDTSSRSHNKSPEVSSTASGDKDYSFFANDEVVSGMSVNVAFFPDASRSAGESSSNEEDVVTVETSGGEGESRTERKSRKNRKKKK